MILTSVPPTLEGDLCPTTVQLTCTAVKIANLRWFINDTVMAAYVHIDNGEDFPRSAQTDNLPPGIVVQITSAAFDAGSPDLIDATSTLTANTTALQEFNMQNIDITCGSNVIRSDSVILSYAIWGKTIP